MLVYLLLSLSSVIALSPSSDLKSVGKVYSRKVSKYGLFSWVKKEQAVESLQKRYRHYVVLNQDSHKVEQFSSLFLLYVQESIVQPRVKEMIKEQKFHQDLGAMVIFLRNHKVDCLEEEITEELKRCTGGKGEVKQHSQEERMLFLKKVRHYFQKEVEESNNQVNIRFLMLLEGVLVEEDYYQMKGGVKEESERKRMGVEHLKSILFALMKKDDVLSTTFLMENLFCIKQKDYIREDDYMNLREDSPSWPYSVHLRENAFGLFGLHTWSIFEQFRLIQESSFFVDFLDELIDLMKKRILPLEQKELVVHLFMFLSHTDQIEVSAELGQLLSTTLLGECYDWEKRKFRKEKVIEILTYDEDEVFFDLLAIVPFFSDEELLFFIEECEKNYDYYGPNGRDLFVSQSLIIKGKIQWYMALMNHAVPYLNISPPPMKRMIRKRRMEDSEFLLDQWSIPGKSYRTFQVSDNVVIKIQKREETEEEFIDGDVMEYLSENEESILSGLPIKNVGFPEVQRRGYLTEEQRETLEGYMKEGVNLGYQYIQFRTPLPNYNRYLLPQFEVTPEEAYKGLGLSGTGGKVVGLMKRGICPEGYYKMFHSETRKHIITINLFAWARSCILIGRLEEESNIEESNFSSDLRDYGNILYDFKKDFELIKREAMIGSEPIYFDKLMNMNAFMEFLLSIRITFLLNKEANPQWGDVDDIQEKFIQLNLEVISGMIQQLRGVEEVSYQEVYGQVRQDLYTRLKDEWVQLRTFNKGLSGFSHYSFPTRERRICIKKVRLCQSLDLDLPYTQALFTFVQSLMLKASLQNYQNIKHNKGEQERQEENSLIEERESEFMDMEEGENERMEGIENSLLKISEVKVMVENGAKETLMCA